MRNTGTDGLYDTSLKSAIIPTPVPSSWLTVNPGPLIEWLLIIKLLFSVVCEFIIVVVPNIFKLLAFNVPNTVVIPFITVNSLFNCNKDTLQPISVTLFKFVIDACAVGSTVVVTLVAVPVFNVCKTLLKSETCEATILPVIVPVTVRLLVVSNPVLFKVTEFKVFTDAVFILLRLQLLLINVTPPILYDDDALISPFTSNV